MVNTTHLKSWMCRTYPSKIGVGYIESESNAADSISKYSKFPVAVCNSPLYQHGPNLTGKEMEGRVVISYQHGVEPTFNGERLLYLANQEENIKKSRAEAKEEKVLFTTRSQAKKGNLSAEQYGCFWSLVAGG